MKHKMNGKYYAGPSGVFYDIKRDEILTLEHTGVRFVRWRPKYKDLAPMYEMKSRTYKHKNVAITGMRNLIRLGEL